MNTRFINFEGIHGSGKSACAWNLYNNLNTNNIKAVVFFEYHMNSTIENPCDVRMTAVMTEKEFEAVIQSHSVYEELLRDKLKIYNGWYCVFVPDFKEYPIIYDLLRPYIADNGNLKTERFMQALKGRITAFVEQALSSDLVYVFENVIFQQILNELMRTMDCDEQQMTDYILEVEQILKPLNPLIFYLYPDDLFKQINKVALERVSDNYELYPDWIDWMVEYLENSEYGRIHKVSGREDLMIYFEKRRSIEEKCFGKLRSNKEKIYVDRIDYDEENAYIYSKYSKL
ncbi:hypothetical protein [Paenibacillus silagei]|uniref:Deoxynucleoside kinase domain-containing protein n=1 Tax=Paenibacillus silagei TaxID=1670801 RepID=A0ABS4NZP3_9BACL|nr:hypothetical protein [Paenibacillus silagei]MBP2115530.1 hypothetical protein [Paenibacillus silagei]